MRPLCLAGLFLNTLVVSAAYFAGLDGWCLTVCDKRRASKLSFCRAISYFWKDWKLKQATCIQAKQRSHNVVNWRNPFPVVLTSGRGRNVLLRDNGDLAEAERWGIMEKRVPYGLLWWAGGIPRVCLCVCVSEAIPGYHHFLAVHQCLGGWCTQETQKNTTKTQQKHNKITTKTQQKYIFSSL